jgi:hypothetical protein
MYENEKNETCGNYSRNRGFKENYGRDEFNYDIL